MRTAPSRVSSKPPAADVGVSQTFNLALRRLQLSVTQDRPFAAFSLASLSQPYAVVPRPRRLPFFHRPVLTCTNFVERLAAALADPLLTNDVLDLSSPSGACRSV